LLQPELNALKKHAARYGTAEVMDTALEMDPSLEQIIELLTCIRAVEDKARTFKPPKRLSVENQAKRLLGIEEEQEAK